MSGPNHAVFRRRRRKKRLREVPTHHARSAHARVLCGVRGVRVVAPRHDERKGTSFCAQGPMDVPICQFLLFLQQTPPQHVTMRRERQVRHVCLDSLDGGKLVPFFSNKHASLQSPEKRGNASCATVVSKLACIRRLVS